MDGIEGEHMALRGRFDAIVLDLMLPRRSGLEVLASVRKALPRVPVIVLSARGEIEIRRVEGLDAGAFDYLVKPFSMAELVARVRAHLRTVTQASASTLSAEGIEVDLLSRRVCADDGWLHFPRRSSSYSSTYCATMARPCPAGRSSARSGAISTIRRRTSWTYTSATYAASSPATATPPRSRRSAPSGIASAAQADRDVLSSKTATRRRLRWRLAGWLTLVMLLCIAILFVAVYRGTGTQLRHQIDAEIAGDAAELAHNLTASDARTPRQLSQAATRYIRGQPFSASSTLLFVLIPTERPSTNRPELFGDYLPDDGETPAQQAQENKLSAHLLSAADDYNTLALPDVGDLRVLKRAVHFAGGLTATVGVGGAIRHPSRMHSAGSLAPSSLPVRPFHYRKWNSLRATSGFSAASSALNTNIWTTCTPSSAWRSTITSTRWVL